MGRDAAWKVPVVESKVAGADSTSAVDWKVQGADSNRMAATVAATAAAMECVGLRAVLPERSVLIPIVGLDRLS